MFSECYAYVRTMDAYALQARLGSAIPKKYHHGILWQYGDLVQCTACFVVHCTLVQKVLPQNIMVVLAQYNIVCNLPWYVIVFCIIVETAYATHYCLQAVHVYYRDQSIYISAHILYIHHTAIIIDANNLGDNTRKCMKRLSIDVHNASIYHKSDC